MTSKMGLHKSHEYIGSLERFSELKAKKDVEARFVKVRQYSRYQNGNDRIQLKEDTHFPLHVESIGSSISLQDHAGKLYYRCSCHRIFVL